MTTARDIMHEGARCVGEHESMADAARIMRDLNVGALPICGDDDRLRGMVTDRDIAVRCIAEGYDPDQCQSGEFAQGKPYYVDADADTDEVLSSMIQHRVRRLPVVESHRLVGIISEGDLAKRLPDRVSDFLAAVTTA